MKRTLLITLLTLGCAPAEKVTKEDPLHMTCVRTGSYIERCENEEVICYRYIGHALNCYLKLKP